MTAPAVTAVIPTIGRPTLVRAVHSVRAQVGQDLHVIVVDDSTTNAATKLLEGQAGVEVIATGGQRGAGYARSLGTEMVRTHWVAYLDDDDEWLPAKTLTQLEAAADPLPSRLIVAGQFLQRTKRGDVVVPEEVYRGESLADYLFVKRRLSLARNSIQTSTLLLPRDLATQVGWRSNLVRHQDWDFLLRASKQPDVRILQLAQPLSRVGYGSYRSISRTPDWKPSLAWATESGVEWSPQARADFLAGQPLRYAMQARSLSGVRATVGLLRGLPRPSVNALALALAGLIPPERFVRLLARSSRHRGMPRS